GTPGNNQEVNASWNGDLSTILDNNADTWFEYEQVVSKNLKSVDPLILDITVNLGTEQVINYIRINPNNFGTKTIIQIENIETSIDGQTYISVKDDVPIDGLETDDEENIFTLSPSTSKYAGQGIYSFTPRKVKYIHFIFKQDEAYVINTPTGEKLRYAIGLRDIEMRGYHYLNEGEVVSREFSIIGQQIRKIALDTNQNPNEESPLGSIEYYVSADSGQTWNQIRPKYFNAGANQANLIPEILDYNGS